MKLTVGMDLGKRRSQVSVRNERGDETSNVRIDTSVAGLTEYFGKLPAARVLVEAGTPVRWIQKLLVKLKHEVIVADPNFLPMYVDEKSKRKKTDKRDASLLSQALFKNNYRIAHLRSETEQIRKTLVDTRARLVADRTKHINGVRAVLSQWGQPSTGCDPTNFEKMADPLLRELPKELQFSVRLELKVLRDLNTKIRQLDRQITKDAKSSPAIKRLMTLPGVGAITATTFVATIDDPRRFGDGHELASYMGLAPSEMSSGERRVLGHITKRGPRYLRSLLVQVAWAIVRTKDPDSAHLKAWAECIAGRRGKRISVVALARKVGGILLSMWKNEQEFSPTWASRQKQSAA